MGLISRVSSRTYRSYIRYFYVLNHVWTTRRQSKTFESQEKGRKIRRRRRYCLQKEATRREKGSRCHGQQSQRKRTIGYRRYQKIWQKVILPEKIRLKNNTV